MLDEEEISLLVTCLLGTFLQKNIGFSEKAILSDVIDDDGLSELGDVHRAWISVGEIEMIGKPNSLVLLNDDDSSGLHYVPLVVVSGGDIKFGVQTISYEMWDHDVKSERRCISPDVFLKGYWVHRECHLARYVDRRRLTWIWFSSSYDDHETDIEFIGDRLIWCRTTIFLNFMTFSWKRFCGRLRLYEKVISPDICVNDEFFSNFRTENLESDIVRYIGSGTGTSASTQNSRYPPSDATTWISRRRSRPRRCHGDPGDRTDSESIRRTLSTHRNSSGQYIWEYNMSRTSCLLRVHGRPFQYVTLSL